MNSVKCAAGSMGVPWLTPQKKYASETPALSQSFLLMDVRLGAFFSIAGTI